MGCSVRMALRADNSNARYRSGTQTGYRPIATHARETTRPCSASLQSSEKSILRKRVPSSNSSQSKAWKAREETSGKAKNKRYSRYGRARINAALGLAALCSMKTSVAMLEARTSRLSAQGNSTRKSN